MAERRTRETDADVGTFVDVGELADADLSVLETLVETWRRARTAG